MGLLTNLEIPGLRLKVDKIISKTHFYRIIDLFNLQNFILALPGLVVTKNFEALVFYCLFQAVIAKPERFSFNKLALSLLPDKFAVINS